MNKIDNAIIWQVVELAEAAKSEPQLLEDYPEEFQKIIRQTVAVAKVRAETVEDLESEVGDLYSEVQDLGLHIASEDQDAQTAYLKLKAQLIGKIVDLKERVLNMKMMKQFQDKVLAAVDAVLQPEQRTEFMKILER